MSAKGKRIVSCKECRRLKIKCDLKFPCAHCVKRGLGDLCPDDQLVYGARKTKVLISQEPLRHRILQLEEALSSFRPGHPLLASENGQSSASTDDEAPSVPTSYGKLIMGESPEVSRYFGSACSVYLSRRTIPTVDHVPRVLAPQLHSDLSLVDPYHADRASIIPQIIARYLPSEEAARRLGRIYFDTISWWTDVIPENTWEHKFIAPIYLSHDPPAPQCLALLFLVLSIGVLMDLERPPRDPLAREYLSAAETCMALDPTHSVTSVQYVYVYGVALMNGVSENVSGDAYWPLLRQGCAIAEAIGLHRDGSQWGLDEALAEERRCVFWSMHAFDVVQSIALGRGQCIASSQIDCRIHPTSEFFTYKNRFMELISLVNNFLLRVRPAQTYAEVCDLDAKISHFEKTLPVGLSGTQQPTHEEVIDDAQRRQALERNMLQMYITETRLALHRPYFVQSLAKYPDEPTDSPYKRSFLGCLEACRTIISLVSNLVMLYGPLIYRRWHFLFHLFSACACLAACGIRAHASILARTVVSELERGIRILEDGGRPEVAMIKQLRDKAMMAGQLGREAIGDEMDDLDLLGARPTLTSPPAPAPPIPVQQDDFWDTEFDFDTFMRDMGIEL